MLRKAKPTLYYAVLLIFLSLLIQKAEAQLPANCGGTSPRVAIAGDSWAQYTADDDVYNDAFKMYGHGDKVVISETFEIDLLCSGNAGANDYAVSGSEAQEWADEVNFDYLQNLIDAINANPSLEFVILSIGGNDILRGRSGGGWYQDMDLDVPGSEAALFNTVNNDTWYIMNQVWARARSDIRFVIMSYDFPNFNVAALWCGFYACGKREDLSRDANGNGSIDNGELITDLEISNMMVTVEGIRKAAADSHPLVHYDNSMGLTHHYYGYDDGQYPSFNAGTTPAPGGYTPYAPGGDLGTPTDRDNFRLVGVCGLPGLLSADPIHLDEDSYLFKSKNLFDNLFFDYYRGKHTETIWSEDTYDGYVDRITGNTNNNGIRVGDYAGNSPSDAVTNDYRGIISFNTSSIPDDATVEGVSLYLMRSGANDNPFNHNDRNPVLDIKSGHFGSSAGLETIDATDLADATNIGCFHGKADQNKYAIRIDIDESALQYINLTGQTQFRFYFDYADWSPEYINFYDGGGTAARLPEHLKEPPVYESRTIRKITDAEGKVTEVEISRGPLIERREGFVYQEKLRAQRVIDDHTIEEDYVLRDVIEHPGLSQLMSRRYGAPGSGFAPFLDVSWTTLLPVELNNFDVSKSGWTALLNWSTLSEINSAHFDIERSGNGINWEKIGMVSSANNSTEVNHYQFVDRQPYDGINYYRLKMVDSDQTFEFSDIKSVFFEKRQLEIKSYPNPFTNELSIEINGNIENTAIVEIHDVLGRIVYNEQFTLASRSQVLSLHLDPHLQKGIYFVHVTSGIRTKMIKVVKE